MPKMLSIESPELILKVFNDEVTPVLKETITRVMEEKYGPQWFYTQGMPIMSTFQYAGRMFERGIPQENPIGSFDFTAIMYLLFPYKNDEEDKLEMTDGLGKELGLSEEEMEALSRLRIIRNACAHKDYGEDVDYRSREAVLNEIGKAMSAVDEKFPERLSGYYGGTIDFTKEDTSDLPSYAKRTIADRMKLPKWARDEVTDAPITKPFSIAHAWYTPDPVVIVDQIMYPTIEGENKNPSAGFMSKEETMHMGKESALTAAHEEALAMPDHSSRIMDPDDFLKGYVIYHVLRHMEWPEELKGKPAEYKKEARDHWRRGAEKGDILCRLIRSAIPSCLSSMDYPEHGLGVEEDYKRAYYHYVIASGNSGKEYDSYCVLVRMALDSCKIDKNLCRFILLLIAAAQYNMFIFKDTETGRMLHFVQPNLLIFLWVGGVEYALTMLSENAIPDRVEEHEPRRKKITTDYMQKIRDAGYDVPEKPSKEDWAEYIKDRDEGRMP